MNYIDYGFGILPKDCFSSLPNNKVIDLADIYVNLVETNELLGYEVKQRFYEIGSFDGIEETNEYIRNKYKL
jgi:NDP-sugar pyrophosphorylase family protein